MPRAIRNEMKQMICANTVSFLELELKNLNPSHQEIAWIEINDLSKKLPSQAFAKFSQNIVWAVYLSIKIVRWFFFYELYFESAAVIVRDVRNWGAISSRLSTDIEEILIKAMKTYNYGATLNTN